MRKPAKKTNVEEFIRAADSPDHDVEPWKQNLKKKYDKTTGKTINVRLPEHYAKCLEWLSEQDNRSQHGQLVYLLCNAIDQAIEEESNT